jgi:hypothetical protein
MATMQTELPGFVGSEFEFAMVRWPALRLITRNSKARCALQPKAMLLSKVTHKYPENYILLNIDTGYVAPTSRTSTTW